MLLVMVIVRSFLNHTNVGRGFPSAAQLRLKDGLLLARVIISFSGLLIRVAP